MPSHATAVLVVGCLLLGFVGIFTRNRGWGELYPFFAWQLYSKPLGANDSVLEYRIYASQDGLCYQRMAVQATAAFSRDEYVYTLQHLASQPVHDSLKARRLLAFCQNVAPGYTRYRIVAERYYASTVQRTAHFDTTTVCLLP